MDAENTNETPVEVQPTAEELRTSARNLVSAYLSNPTGQAQTMVETLDDAEVKAIVDAGKDRSTAKEAIKGVFTSAYDRRQREHNSEAAADQKRLQTRSKACRVMAAAGVSTERSQAALKQFSDGELSILANLDGEHNVKEVVEAVLKRASDRAVIVEPVEPVTVATGPETLTVADLQVNDLPEPGVEPVAIAPEPLADEPKPAKKKK